MNEIIVAAYVSIPYVNPCFQLYANQPHLCPDPGIELSFLHSQLSGLSFRAKFLLVENYSRMLSVLESGQADIGAITQNMDDKPELLDITHPALDDGFAFVVHSDKQNRIIPHILLSNCDWMVWCLFLGSFALLVAPHTLGQWMPPMTSLSEMFSVKLAFLVWSLCFNVFLTLFSEYMSLTLISPGAIVHQFKSFAELSRLIYEQNCTLIISQSTYIEIFNTPENLTIPDVELKWLNFFKSALDAGFVKIILNDDVVVENLKSEKCTYGVIWKSAFPIFQSRYPGFDLIDLDDTPKAHYGFYFRKNFPLSNRLRLINSENPNGLYDYHVSRAIAINNQKNALEKKIYFVENNRIQADPLKLSQLDSIFVLLIISGLIGLVVMFFNRAVVWKNKNHYNVYRSGRKLKFLSFRQ